MADWTRLNILPSNAPVPDVLASRNTRILQDTSGNIQTYAPEVKHENGSFAYSRQSLQFGQSHLQPIQNHLPSNDHEGNLQHLHSRRRQRQREQRSIQSTGAFWEHKRYQDYRNRPERGKLKTDSNEEVWPDRVEEAFCDGQLLWISCGKWLIIILALMNIPCYGRKKKSQNNRPHGRNELIALWIKEATGVIRSRKQISSHIQVLKSKMKGITAWDKVSTPQADDGSFNGPGSRYYSNSIENDVKDFYGNMKGDRKLRSRCILGSNTRHPLMANSTLGSNAAAHYGRRVCGLNFKMWVSPKDHKDFRERVWDYTRSADGQGSPSAPPMSLESVPNWRESFPDLPSIIAKQPPHVDYDIILVSSGLKLMANHPPRHSQLGLNLELDLFPRGSGNTCSVAQSWSDWRGITHIYKDGKPVKDHKPASFTLWDPDPHVGKLNTSFESRWWAQQLMLLTECEREAKDSGSEAELAAANETIRHFFEGTTAMQEFRADSNPFYGKMGGASAGDTSDNRNTVIILLWKFHQVHNSNIGTTSWQVLVPAPARITTNSPHPAAEEEMSLPPLAIDSRLSTSEFEPQQQQRLNAFQSPSAFDPYHIYPDTLPGNTDFISAGDSNFDFFRPDEDLTSFHPSTFDLPVPDLAIPDFDPSTSGAEFSQSHHHHSAFDFDQIPHSDPPTTSIGATHPLSYHHHDAVSNPHNPLPHPESAQDLNAITAFFNNPHPHPHHTNHLTTRPHLSHSQYSYTSSLAPQRSSPVPHLSATASPSPSPPRRAVAAGHLLPPNHRSHHHRRRPLAELAHSVRGAHDTLQASLEVGEGGVVMDEDLRVAIEGLSDLGGSGGGGGMVVGPQQQQQQQRLLAGPGQAGMEDVVDVGMVAEEGGMERRIEEIGEENAGEERALGKGEEHEGEGVGGYYREHRDGDESGFHGEDGTAAAGETGGDHLREATKPEGEDKREGEDEEEAEKENHGVEHTAADIEVLAQDVEGGYVEVSRIKPESGD
ncbi:MAG: hypothetical protein Q9160_000534 [Pyrenula sp. 1 TL-2023]